MVNMMTESWTVSSAIPNRQFGRTKITADKDLVGQVKAGSA
jgi:hypothetical protein